VISVIDGHNDALLRTRHAPTATQALLDELDWSDDELRRLAYGNRLRVVRETWR